MKKRFCSNICLWSFIVILLCACGKQETRELAYMTTEVNDDYCAIIWEDRTYVPYCAFSKIERGEQLGIVDSDIFDKVYEYRGYSAEEWIINIYERDVMLYKEINISDIPDGLQSEYEWNQ